MATGYRRVRPRMQASDMRGNRVVQTNAFDRDELPLLGKNAGKVLFAHPAYPIPVTAMPTAYDWACGICGFYQKPPDAVQDDNDERYVARRGLFQSALTAIPNNFNVCSSCLKAKCNPWQAQRDAFTQGSPIRFFGLKCLGRLPVTDTWPAHDDQEALLEVLDDAMRNRDLRRRSGPHKFIAMSLSHLDVGDDPDFFKLDQHNPRTDESTKRYPITDAYSLTFVDDNPNFYVLLVVREGSHAVCHVFLLPTAELAVHIVETFDNAIQHLYTEAVLASLEDNIAAGIEGRLTIEEQMQRRRAEEAQRVRAAKRRAERERREEQQRIRQQQQQQQLMQQQREVAELRHRTMSDDEANDTYDEGDGGGMGGVDHVQLRRRISRRRPKTPTSPDRARTRPSQALMDTQGGASRARLSVFGLFGEEQEPPPAPRYNPAQRASFMKVNAFSEGDRRQTRPLRGMSVSTDDDGDATAARTLDMTASSPPPPPPPPSVPAPLAPGGGMTGAQQGASGSSPKEQRRKEREATASGEVKQYMQSLQPVFTTTEMAKFVKLLRTYRSTRDFADFTRQLLDLFGPSRYHHLPGLRAFLKPSDRPEYEAFLREHDIAVN
ncbi:hypothetical protein PTSG_06608 [Salpingoeca rosetta]|uniref:Uncharacterized protein n=1 Tax=Salpingoeca rosetta (strain ATCC 50818 / BSB-021) TaxID=946362 RepID=F2UFH0_SALR5|nr:uncharacterized protein PTSG_06608 [Salpingoeca rosetta]EGD75538.1 hypothetical protein PTSG_06608 [Salpingoeca rosetta]|eukprot:XP_004991995.1 hypothetical protein PTSG_06608 [Salpingoeca rosetta]